MQRILIVFLCLLFITAVQPALAGDGGDAGGNHGRLTDPASDPDQYSIEDMMDAIIEQIMAAFNPDTILSPLPKITDGVDCVNVDIDLLDTVMIIDLLNPVFAQGYFELDNCGGNSQIHLDFQLTVILNGSSDTIVVSEDFSVYMETGQSVSVNPAFPLPPFDAYYELCVTATSGEASMTDCAYMMVDGPGGGGVPYAAPGFLLQGDDCVLFSELGDSNAYLVLQYLYGHVPGDTVFVRGVLVDECEFQCDQAAGCLLYNSIFPWPQYPQFQACGRLFQGADCLLFAPLEMGDTAFALEEYGTFVAGDTVSVSGDFVAGCDNGCTGAMACILNNTIDTCNIPPPPPFSRCGKLVQASECLLFMPDAYGDSLFTLNNYGPFQAGDSVYVEGDLVYGTDTLCSQSLGFIDNDIIDSCGTTQIPFSGCGMLIEDQGCLIFMVYDSLRYILDDYGLFTAGDSVHVQGYIGDCQSTCPNITGCMYYTVIESCEYVPPTPIPFEGCGRIIEVAGCTIFRSHGLVSEDFLLSDFGSCQVGDSVYVNGHIYPVTDTVECSLPLRYILVTSLGPCQNNPPGTYSGLGYLMDEGGCMVYYDFNDYYTAFVLENYDGFGAFDTVCVSGTIAVDCQFNCSDTALCLTDNTIIYCGFGDTLMVKNQNSGKISDVRCYPNPFNPVARISFNIPVASQVTLDIFNILGQRVETLIDGEIMQGPQEVEWNGDRYASGIYFYRIQTDYDMIAKKMILSK